MPCITRLTINQRVCGRVIKGILTVSIFSSLIKDPAFCFRGVPPAIIPEDAAPIRVGPNEKGEVFPESSAALKTKPKQMFRVQPTCPMASRSLRFIPPSNADKLPFEWASRCSGVIKTPQVENDYCVIIQRLVDTTGNNKTARFTLGMEFHTSPDVRLIFRRCFLNELTNEVQHKILHKRDPSAEFSRHIFTANIFKFALLRGAGWKNHILHVLSRLHAFHRTHTIQQKNFCHNYLIVNVPLLPVICNSLLPPHPSVKTTEAQFNHITTINPHWPLRTTAAYMLTYKLLNS